MNESAIRYDFLSPQRIVFGSGRRREIGGIAGGLGKRVLVVSGSRTLESSGELESIASSLRAAGLAVEPLASISHEPLVSDVDAVATRLADLGAGPEDVVLAIGGGSAIDLAKAAAAMATNGQSSSVADYLEGVGRGLAITHRPLPLIAMPTTGGTGTEATKNAVISSFDPPFKKSLRSDWLLPSVVLVDPELALSLPPSTTAYTGMDAITQLIESYLSRRAQPIPQALALSGLELSSRHIETAVAEGHSLAAREAMAQAALLSGMALANSGLGLAHGVAAALGIHARVPHGLACAVLLPAAMRVNRSVRETELARLAEVMTGRRFNDAATAADAALAFIDNLCTSLHIPRKLGQLGVSREQIPQLVAASRGNSMSGNPRDVGDLELTELLEEML